MNVINSISTFTEYTLLVAKGTPGEEVNAQIASADCKPNNFVFYTNIDLWQFRSDQDCFVWNSTVFCCIVQNWIFNVHVKTQRAGRRISVQASAKQPRWRDRCGCVTLWSTITFVKLKYILFLGIFRHFSSINGQELCFPTILYPFHPHPPPKTAGLP